MIDTYFDTLLRNVFVKTADFRAIISLVFLFLARMLPIIALSPFFGARTLPNPVKVFFALTLFMIFLPYFLATITVPLAFNPLLVLLILKELFIGLLIGFIVGIPFIIVQTAGMLVDHQRGGASLMVNDPTIQNQSSPLGLLFNWVLIYIFWAMDAPFLLLDAIFTSYQIIPSDTVVDAAFFTTGSPFWKMLLSLLNKTMIMAIQLATPALIAILMTNVFLGIANRLAPQVQITFLGMPLQSLLGLGVICLGWKLLTAEFVCQSYLWVLTIFDLLKMFQFKG